MEMIGMDCQRPGLGAMQQQQFKVTTSLDLKQLEVGEENTCRTQCLMNINGKKDSYLERRRAEEEEEEEEEMLVAQRFHVGKYTLPI